MFNMYHVFCTKIQIFFFKNFLLLLIGKAINYILYYILLSLFQPVSIFMSLSKCLIYLFVSFVSGCAIL